MTLVKSGKKVLPKVLNVAFWVVLVVVFIYSVVALFSVQTANLRTMFGISTMSVQSESMNPTFKKGDLIFVSTNYQLSEIKPDDVITYRMMVSTPQGSVEIFNTHRVVQVNLVSGVYWFVTKGDNNPSNDVSPIFGNDVVGVWTGGKLPSVGEFTDNLVVFIQSSTGFFLFIVVPCFVFLAFEVFKFVKVMSDYSVQKTLGDRVKMQEEAIAQARAQIEAELKEKMKTD